MFNPHVLSWIAVAVVLSLTTDLKANIENKNDIAITDLYQFLTDLTSLDVQKRMIVTLIDSHVQIILIVYLRSPGSCQECYPILVKHVPPA
ncbi:hypothetical protein Tco_1418250 [Tanacetum coccineum]